jgi:DnaJ like chaperone protein
MADTDSHKPLPKRLQKTLDELLKELDACGHQAHTLVARTQLPGWGRRSLFYFLGYIARADSRVTPKDIQFSESLMKALNLSDRKRRLAIAQFQLGKEATAPDAFRGLRLRLSRYLSPAPALQVVFCLCHATQLHGDPSRERRYRCEDALQSMGLPERLMERVLESYAKKVWITRPEKKPAPTSYEQACNVLGVSAKASMDELKRTYRRRISECHPDKLALDISAQERARAKDRLLRYQQAWELIRQREKIRRS